MTWEQKLAALQAIADAQLCMRKPGDWYVHQHVEVKRGNVLCGDYGNGADPEEAVLDHWIRLTSLPPDEYLVTRAMGDDRKAVRWNGFMWDHVLEPQPQEGQPR